MAVGIYLRVSTEEQRERQSIATQRDFAGRYCDLHQLSIHAEYADDGVSGTVPLDRRPEGARLLRDARLKKFDQLLVYKLDRLGRETRLTLEAVAELEKCGAVRSMTEEFDSQTPNRAGMASDPLNPGACGCVAISPPKHAPLPHLRFLPRGVSHVTWSKPLMTTPFGLTAPRALLTQRMTRWLPW